MNAKSSRPDLDEILAQARPSDTIVIWKLDLKERSHLFFENGIALA